MGLHHAEVVASAIGSLAAMSAVVAIGVLALVVVRRAHRDDEPLFPELERERPGTPDAVAFTEQLAAGGTVTDDVTRAGAVASASGFEQAYALLALVDGEGDPRIGELAVAPVVAPAIGDPYAQLARIDEPADDELALAAFADGTPDTLRETGSATSRATDSADTLLPPGRSRRLRPRTA